MLEAQTAANLKFFPGDPKELLQNYVNAYEECHRLLERKRAEALTLKQQLQKNSKPTLFSDSIEQKLASCNASIALLEQRLQNYSTTSRVRQVFEATSQATPESTTTSSNTV